MDKEDPRRLIQSLEWIAMPGNGAERFCPACGQWEAASHAPDCRLLRYLMNEAANHVWGQRKGYFEGIP